MKKSRDMACHADTESGIRSMGERTQPIEGPKGVSRRGFLGFFMLGGLISLFYKNVNETVRTEDGPKEAMFWRRKSA